jgi:hypothetical protein
LAAVDPTSEQITKFTAADGLPPMEEAKGWGGLTPLGPGRILIAGCFERSWAAIATFSADKGKALDVFFEARELRQSGRGEQWKAKSVASPVGFIDTINVPAAEGRAAGQWVLLDRGGFTYPPLVFDPDKRTAEVLSGRPATPTCVHEGIAYGLDRTGVVKLNPVYRGGLPAFDREPIGPHLPSGQCFAYGGNVYIWSLKQLLRAPSFRGPFEVSQCTPPISPQYQYHGMKVALSHHYGIILLTHDGLRSVELRRPSASAGSDANRQE